MCLVEGKVHFHVHSSIFNDIVLKKWRSNFCILHKTFKHTMYVMVLKWILESFHVCFTYVCSSFVEIC